MRGDQRHLQAVQQMGQTMDRDGLEAWIAEDHLVERADGGIAVVGGLHIGGEHPPQIGNAFQELHRFRLAERLEIPLLGAMLHGIGHRGRSDAVFGGDPLR